MTKLSASFEFSGFSDYWSGNGRRWDYDAGCLFAYYSANTTLRDLIDQWVDDFNAGGECDDMPEGITDSDVREALLEMLSDGGRKNYENDAICEFSAEYTSANGLEVGADIEGDDSSVAIVLLEVVKDD